MKVVDLVFLVKYFKFCNTFACVMLHSYWLTFIEFIVTMKFAEFLCIFIDEGRSSDENGKA